TNFLKKIHTRFKRELQEVRFQGWQDAQVLEIEDKMTEREFQMVFHGIDDSDPSSARSRHSSASPAPSLTGSSTPTIQPSPSNSLHEKSADQARVSVPRVLDSITIKIEDDDDDEPLIFSKPSPDNIEVRTYQSEASVGELFGHRWRTEPVVGYTLVHFGGSDRTRMVPMNPTVPSLTVSFNRASETITFSFRVLVNGLCLLSSGGGPPALHMPEIGDDEEFEEEEADVVVVPDNDKDETLPTSGSNPSTAVTSQASAKKDVASTPNTDQQHATDTSGGQTAASNQGKPSDSST
ncbi:hypothetical protein BGW38_000285, partial [Lunasporangiospora selenospora]